MSRQTTAVGIRILAGKNAKEFSQVYKQAIKESKDAIIENDLYEAFKSGSIDAVQKAVGLEQFSAKMSEVVSPVTSAFIAGSKQAFKELPTRVGQKARSIDLMSPFVKQYINNHSANLVTNITEETRIALKDAIRKMMRSGASYRAMANDIQKFIGLTIPQQNKLEKLRSTLINNKLNQEQVDSALGKQWRIMIKARAETIGRTESFNAIGAGRQGMWSQLAKDGVIELETKRIWYTSKDERECEICASLHNQKKGINEPFVADNGLSVMAPAAHPNCRCTVVLDI